MNTSIKILSFMVLSSFIFMGGCLKKLTTANFDYTTQGSFKTENVDQSGEFTLGETTLTSTLKDELSKNNTSLDLIDALTLRSAEITIEEASAVKNFNSIEKAELYISTDDLPEVLLATINPVPQDVQTVSFVVSNSENLMNYLKGTTFTITAKGKTTGPIAPMDLKVKAIWTIKASAK